MSKRNKNNIINLYTDKIIDEYYDNPYINNNIKDYLKRCLNNLLKCNSYLHITPKFKDIVSLKKLYCSSGGLGGVVYTVPLYNNSIHNLGDYIINKELPMFLNDNNSIDGIIIESINNKIGYVDYLDYGKWYYYIYKNNNYDIDKYLLDKYINNIIDDSNKIISLVDNPDNINEIFNIMSNSKILKVYLFELVLEYLFLFQKDTYSNSLNNCIVKDYIYELCPKLREKFSLSNFNISYDSLYNTIKDNYDISNIKEYFTSRVVFYLNKYILNNNDNLYGQVIFRCFNYRRELELEFSKLLWKDAKKNNYNILTYIIPKGEMGILPTHYYNIYSCSIDNNKFLKKDILDVIIIDELYKHNIMRNPYDKEG